MLQILKFILKNNRLTAVPKYLFLGLLFQIFKRLTNSIVSKQIFNGKKLLLFPDCNVSSSFTYTDIPDKKEIMILRELASDGDVVFFDIGANIGSYSICLADLCREVVAFEPHPLTAGRCKMNFILNNMPVENVKQLAISSETGTTHFSDYGGSSTINHIVNDDQGIAVKTSTLDDFVKQYNYQKTRKYLLKIDVEGHEKEVLLGAEDFLANYDVVGVIFECFSRKDVIEFLNERGFKVIEKIGANNYFAAKN